VIIILKTVEKNVVQASALCFLNRNLEYKNVSVKRVDNVISFWCFSWSPNWPLTVFSTLFGL